jgi:hypothetical protein
VRYSRSVGFAERGDSLQGARIVHGKRKGRASCKRLQINPALIVCVQGRRHNAVSHHTESAQAAGQAFGQTDAFGRPIPAPRWANKAKSRAANPAVYVQTDAPFPLSQRQTVTSRNWPSCGISSLADGAHFAKVASTFYLLPTAKGGGRSERIPATFFLRGNVGLACETRRTTPETPRRRPF